MIYLQTNYLPNIKVTLKNNLKCQNFNPKYLFIDI